MINIDNNLSILLNSLTSHSVFLNYMIVFLADYLAYIVVVLVLIFILPKELKNLKKENYLIKVKDAFKKVVIVFAPASVAWFFATIIKDLFKRPRPFIELSDSITPLFTHGGMDSFPSGHSTFFIALGICVLSLNKKFGWFLIICAVLIGITRIISGIHFPIDVLSGFIIGIIFSYLFNLYLKNKAK